MSPFGYVIFPQPTSTPSTHYPSNFLLVGNTSTPLPLKSLTLVFFISVKTGIRPFFASPSSQILPSQRLQPSFLLDFDLVRLFRLPVVFTILLVFLADLSVGMLGLDRSKAGAVLSSCQPEPLALFTYSTKQRNFARKLVILRLWTCWEREFSESSSGQQFQETAFGPLRI